MSQNKLKNSFFVNKDFDIIILINVLKKTWFYVPIVLAFFAISSVLILRYSKPIYESGLVIQIVSEDQGADLLNIKNINEKASLSSEVELLKSELLFEKALKKLDLSVSHFAEGEFLTENRYKGTTFKVNAHQLKDSLLCGTKIYLSSNREDNVVNLDFNFQGQVYNYSLAPNSVIATPFFKVDIEIPSWSAFVSDSDVNKLYFVFNDQNHLTRSLLPNLSVELLNPSARTLEIAFQSNNAKLSHDVVEVLAEAFFDNDEKLKKQSAEKVLNFIEIQLDSLTKELSSSKDAIMNYQRLNNIPNPEEVSSSLMSKINGLNQELTILDDQMRILNDVFTKINNDNSNSLEVYRMIPIIMGTNFNSSLLTSVEELQNLLERKEDLLFNITDENNTIKLIEKRILVLVDNINRTIDLIASRIKERRGIVIEEIKAFESEYYNLPEKKMELARLGNMQSLNEKYYNLFTEKQVLYSISNAGYTSQSKVLKKPIVASVPVSPNKSIIYAAAAVLAFLLSALLILLKYLSYNEINNLNDLEKLLPERVGVLGAIPSTKQKMKFSQIVVSDRPKSMMAESFRSIRTNLSFVNKSAKLYAVSSSISGEGKTFVSLNLSAIIALSGKKTIVIDLDMRKPKVHLGLNANNDFGMSNLLSGQVELKNCIQKSHVKNLDFISAGPIPPNPAELILSSEFEKVIQELALMYDKIIIDNPPVGIVADGVGIMAMVDVPIYIFKAQYSKRHFVARIDQLLKQQNVKNINVILNGVKANHTANGYGYGYGYGYGGYYEDEQKQSIIQRIIKRKK